MTLVRNGVGEPLPCCWDDCWKHGHEEHKVVKRGERGNLHYVFCSEQHRLYYVNGHRSYGNVGVR